MFKGGNGKVDTTNSPERLNRIVEGTKINGDIKSESNFRLDGTLEGTIDTLGKLVIGPSGKIEGEIICNNADVEGEIIGNIKVEGVLTLKSTAKITGNIITGKLMVELGAEFNGNCTLGNEQPTKTLPKGKSQSNNKEESPELVY